MKAARRKRSAIAKAMVLFQLAEKAGTKQGFERSQLSLLMKFIDEVDALDAGYGVHVHYDTENVHVRLFGENLVSLNVKGRSHIVWLKGSNSSIRSLCKVAEKRSELRGGVWSDDRQAWYIEEEAFYDRLIKQISELRSGAIKIVEDERTRSIPFAVRAHADEEFKASGGVCPGYGDLPPHDAKGMTLHYDHITPFSRGGSHDFNNIRILCSECNLKKGSAW